MTQMQYLEHWRRHYILTRTILTKVRDPKETWNKQPVPKKIVTFLPLRMFSKEASSVSHIVRIPASLQPIKYNPSTVPAPSLPIPQTTMRPPSFIKLSALMTTRPKFISSTTTQVVHKLQWLIRRNGQLLKVWQKIHSGETHRSERCRNAFQINIANHKSI